LDDLSAAAGEKRRPDGSAGVTNKSRRNRSRANSAKRAPNFTDQSFIQSILKKVAQHRFRASTHKTSGRRFPKEITSDPDFRAIVFCQRWHYNWKRITEQSVEDAVRKMGAEPTEELKTFVERTLGTLRERHQCKRKPELEQRIAQAFASAAIEGNIERLQQLVDLCKLHLKTLERPKGAKSYPVPWHYYVGLAACMYLAKGEIPTKKQVKDAAIQHRAVDQVKHDIEEGKRPNGPIDLKPYLKRLKGELPSRWDRIFRDLLLGDLPSAPTRGAAPRAH
jgi:hypothetical protein